MPNAWPNVSVTSPGNGRVVVGSPATGVSGKPQSKRITVRWTWGSSTRAPMPTECLRTTLVKSLKASPTSKKAAPAKSTEKISKGRERYSRLAAKKLVPMKAPAG